MDDKWTSDDEPWPGWQDLGREVELLFEDGNMVRGELTYEDTTPGPDEWPILQVEMNFMLYRFSDAKRWRYLD
jgi:hypothetical protein